MKNLFYAVACLTILIACSKEQEATQAKEQLNGNKIVLASAKDFMMTGITKTSITQSGIDAPAFAWKAGDIIGVIPMDNETVQSNYKVSEIGSNPKEAIFDGGVWALKEGKEYAAYYPFNEKIARSGDNIEFSFLDQTQSANNSLDHLGIYDYMYASAVVPQSGSAKFNFEHKISLVRLQLMVPKADTYTSVVLESSVDWFANEASLKLSDGTMTATKTGKSAKINLNNFDIADNSTLTIWFATLPTNALSGQTLNVNLIGKEYTCTGEILGLATLIAGNAYSYTSTLTAEKSTTGALPGVFSVSADKKVRFSKGNLQATYNSNTETYTWGFAKNQYDYVGYAAGNTTIDMQTDGSIVDLFGWSTKSTNYGISTSIDIEPYSGDFKDWGKTIGDGNTWRTLTTEEWQYLLNYGSYAYEKRASKYKYKVTVCGKANCLVLAPDDFTGTIEASYDAAAWASAEAAGLVCLPAAGFRFGSSVYYVDDAGYYCSSSALDSNLAYYVYFDSSNVLPQNYGSPNFGYSVRLITESK